MTSSAAEPDSYLVHKPFWIAILVAFAVMAYAWGFGLAGFIVAALVIGAVAGERDRIRKGQRSAAIATPAAPDGVEIVQFPTGLPVAVVGESHYQDALERLCGGREEHGAHQKCVALLVPEDTNPFDPQAIRVDVGGLTVGYLSRPAAKRYRPIAEQLRSEGKIGSASAVIVGGWDRGNGDRGHFGVELDMNPFDG